MTSTFNPAAHMFTPQSSEASRSSTNPRLDHSTAAMNLILSSGTWDTSNMDDPVTSRSTVNNAIVVDGVTYVRAGKEPTAISGLKQSANDGLPHLNVFDETNLVDLAKKVSKLLKDDTQNNQADEHGKTSPNPLFDMVKKYSKVIPAPASASTIGIAAFDSNDVNDAKETSFEVSEAGSFNKQLIEIVLGTSTTRQSYSVHQAVAQKLLAHPDFWQLRQTAKMGKAVHIEFDVYYFQDLIHCLYADLGSDSVRQQTVESILENYTPPDLALFYLTVSYFKLQNIKFFVRLLMDQGQSTLQWMQTARTVYDSAYLDDDFRRMFQRRFIESFLRTLANDYEPTDDPWISTPAKDVLDAIMVGFSRGGELTSDTARAMLYCIAGHHKIELEKGPYSDDIVHWTQIGFSQQTAACDEKSHPKSNWENDNDSPLPRTLPAQSNEKQLQRDSHDFAESGGITWDNNDLPNCPAPVLIESVDQGHHNKGGGGIFAKANDGGKQGESRAWWDWGVAADTEWGAEDNNGKNVHWDIENNPHATNNVQNASQAPHKFVSERPQGIYCSLPRVVTTIPTFANIPQDDPFYNHVSSATQYQGLCAIAIKDAFHPDGNLFFKTNQIVTNIRILPVEADPVQLMRGTCNGMRGTFPATHVATINTGRPTVPYANSVNPFIRGPWFSKETNPSTWPPAD